VMLINMSSFGSNKTFDFDFVLITIITYQA